MIVELCLHGMAIGPVVVDNYRQEVCSVAMASKDMATCHGCGAVVNSHVGQDL